MKNKNFTLLRKILLILVTVFNVNCSTLPIEEQNILKEAHEAYTQASAYPNTGQVEALAEAKAALTKAKQANNKEAREHFAYLTKQYAQLAIVIAKRQTLEATGKNLPELPEQSDIAESNIQQQKLRKQLQEWQQNPTEQLAVVLEDIWFKTSQADLLPAAQKNLNTIATFLNLHPNLKITVAAYTNQVGNAQYNLGLSERRAHSVKFALINRGISSKRIITTGFSENQPLVGNYTNRGYKNNHRVELIIFQEKQLPQGY